MIFKGVSNGVSKGVSRGSVGDQVTGGQGFVEAHENRPQLLRQ